ncbi:MAG: DUF2341 domain-containing protein [Verrucomicrobiota bacterium]
MRSFFLTPFLLAAAASSAVAGDWWNDAWTVRKPITINTGGDGAAIAGAIGKTPVLVRLFDGNFSFDSAQDNGADIRFVAEDNKTVLPHHIERYDRALNEALVWVQAPELKADGSTPLFIYSGNAAQLPAASEAKATYDADTTLVYHFSEASGPPNDSSAGGTNATTTSLPVAGALIAGGVRLTGQNPVAIPSSAPLAWTPGGQLTWSAWIHPASLRPNAVLFSRREGANAFIIGEDNGVPFVEITNGGAPQRTPAGAPLAVDVWRHLAVTVSGTSATLWLDGERYGTVNAALPALNGPSFIGRDDGAGAVYTTGFNGEVDELQIAKTARAEAWLKFASINQGTSPNAGKLLRVGVNEANEKHAVKPNFFKEHFGIFGDISKSLTVDGWAVIVLCSLLALVGGVVALTKFIYLNRIEKASKLFTKRWDDLSSDITALDRADEEELRSLGGSVAGHELTLVRQSPLFHIYHLGAREIRKRIDEDGEAFAGLSGRSIEAIKARLDGGLVDEEEKLNSKLVFLTLGIAGGPYLGLLGTVIGVMITFAVIAKSGEVEVNSIAPGIAGALLATVAGLAVAIPALFSYSYLNSRITSALNGIRRFIDEFITRIAEAYPTKE